MGYDLFDGGAGRDSIFLGGITVIVNNLRQQISKYDRGLLYLEDIKLDPSNPGWSTSR
jgi:hypothetical protein